MHYKVNMVNKSPNTKKSTSSFISIFLKIPAHSCPKDIFFKIPAHSRPEDIFFKIPAHSCPEGSSGAWATLFYICFARSTYERFMVMFLNVPFRACVYVLIDPKARRSFLRYAIHFPRISHFPSMY